MSSCTYKAFCMYFCYLTAFLQRQGISVIPICQKIIWVWTACWMLHEKLPWFWFSSSSQCSLHAPHCVSGPSFKSITFVFWISAYCLHTNVLFAANIPTAFQTWENPQKRCSSLLLALLHESGSCVLLPVLPWISAAPGHFVKSPPKTLSSGWAPGILRMCVGLHQGMVQINNCNLLCTAWMGDTSKLWTMKLIRYNYVFL